MRRRTYDNSIYGDLFEYTDDERKAINAYTGIGYKRINALLANDDGKYETNLDLRENFGRERILSSSEKADKISRYVHDVDLLLKEIPDMYSGMLKSWQKSYDFGRNRFLHRGTSVEEMNELTENEIISKPISTSTDYEGSNWSAFALDNKRPAYVRVEVSPDVPVVFVNDVMDGVAEEKEAVVSPFTRVKAIEKGVNARGRDKDIQQYRLVLEHAELEQLNDAEIEQLKNEIRKDAPEMARMLLAISQKKAVEGEIFWQIEQCQNQLMALFNEKRAKESSGVFLDSSYYEAYREDRKSIENKIEEQKETAKKIDADIADGLPKLREWKQKIAKVCMSECKKKEVELETKMVTLENAHQKAEQERAEERRKLEEKEANIRLLNSKNNERIISLASNIVKNIDACNIQRAVEVSRIMESGMRSLGVIYAPRVSHYVEALFDAKKVANSTVKLLNTTGRTISDSTRGSLENLQKVSEAIAMGSLNDEIGATVIQEENILKGTVFTKFANLVVSTEKKMLKEEAGRLQERVNKKGISAIFNGASKEDRERLDSINKYVASVPDFSRQVDISKNYSARQIVADMQFFIEIHQGDARYSNTLEQVRGLKNTIQSCFNVPENGVQALKNQMLDKSRNREICSFMINQIYEQNYQMPRNNNQTNNLEFARLREAIKDVEMNLDNEEKGRNMAPIYSKYNELGK